MQNESNYLRYLPPVLGEHGPGTPEFSLGSWLRIFEKILTGIDDETRIEHGNHVHEPIATLIDRLHKIFDPWHTPEALLPWLASCVALEFPTLEGQDLWDEYQRRKATAVMAGIHRMGGLREGLNRYLDVLAVGAVRPRVAIDDGRRLLVTHPQPGVLASIDALVTQGPLIDMGRDLNDRVLAEGLIQPYCIAASSDGNLFVGDQGFPSNDINLYNRVLKISTAGQYDRSDEPPQLPQAIFSLGKEVKICAVVVCPKTGTLFVLDSAGKIHKLRSPYEKESTTFEPIGTDQPVAMAVDTDGKRLLVLARGNTDYGTPSKPQIVFVSVDDGKKDGPHDLLNVIEPLSLLVKPDGKLIIGDGGKQEHQFSANLVEVEPTNALKWEGKTLLDHHNPLVAPIAITWDNNNYCYILDLGLKPTNPSKDDPFHVEVAEPAVVYRYDPGASLPITRATLSGQLVFPTGMVTVDKKLFICDPGQPTKNEEEPNCWSRVLPFRFGVVIHFAKSRLPQDENQSKMAQQQIVENLRVIVERYKPAHTVSDLITAIDVVK